jgi:3-isopropylmalate/(R)-2-methylmalate dehydratase small subunit
LEAQVVVRPNGSKIPFDVDAFRKHCLLNGLDDIGLTLEHTAAIDSYEAKIPAWQPKIHGAKR